MLAPPLLRRAAILAVTALAAAAGLFSTTHSQTLIAINEAGPELTRLLRFMAVLKALLAAGAMAGLLWRLGAAVSLPRFAAYAIAAAAMAAGPGLIWDMAHLRLGALLLHGGLAALVVLLWRDPVTSQRLADLVAARRRALRS